MTDQERDELLLELRARLQDHGARLDRIEGKVDAVDNRISDLRRDLVEQFGMADEPNVATG